MMLVIFKFEFAFIVNNYKIYHLNILTSLNRSTNSLTVKTFSFVEFSSEAITISPFNAIVTKIINNKIELF